MGNRVRSSLLALSMIILCSLTVYAGGTPEPPKVIEKPDTQYLSPNGDGVQDEADLKFKVELYVKSDEGYIPESRLKITDQSGNVIREVKETEERDIGFFASIFRGYEKFTREGELKWDGKREDGTVVSDGEYDVVLTVLDASKKPIDVTMGKVFNVDTSVPQATFKAVGSPFSPDADGNKDTLQIELSGSSEDSWKGTVEKSGTAVRTFTWQSSAPISFGWDGKTDDGPTADNGTYDFRLASTDRAGNKYDKLFSGDIVVDVQITPITVSVDNEHFSPNGDGVKEVATITLGADVEEGISSWNVTVADVDGPEKWKYEGGTTLESEIVFDGNDQSGVRLKDGNYWASFSVKYENGNQMSQRTLISVDTTDPQVTIDVKNPVFSPNGDGVKDKVEISMKSSEIVTWVGNVYNSQGVLLKQTSSQETTSLIVLDGLDPSGRPLPEGIYTIDVSFTDRAGNVIEGKGKAEIDLTAAVITADIDPSYLDAEGRTYLFSPDGDGIKDNLPVLLRSSEKIYGTGEIRDSSGRILGTYSIPSAGISQAELEWDGTGIPGVSPTVGDYQFTGKFYDEAGNLSTLGTLNVRLDARKTDLHVAVLPLFSPNGDGTLDTLPISVDASLNEGIEEWSVDVQDTLGRTQKSFSGSGSIPSSFTWDGTTGSGKSSEGLYQVRVKASYSKGNQPQATSIQFILDVTAPVVDLGLTLVPFIKTDTGIEGEALITLAANDESGIDTWLLDIVDQSGATIRSFGGSGQPDASISWKGEGDRGKTVTPGQRFTIDFVTVDLAGNKQTFRRPLDVEIIVVRREGNLYLIVPNIIFGAYKHTLDSAGSENEKQNWATLQKVMEISRRYPQFSLLLEGHALNIYLGLPDKEREEEKVLYPLTERRIESVRQALIRLGMSPEKVLTRAYGGQKPIAPVTNISSRWKNRRVEFMVLVTEVRD